MLDKSITASDSPLVSELVDDVLHLIFSTSDEKPSSVEEVEELFHVFRFPAIR